MVVGMDVENDEGPTSCQDIEPPADLVVERVVSGKGFLNGVRVQLCPPNLKTPGLIRNHIDRLVPGPVEVDLEAGSVNGHPQWDDVGEQIRVGIFFTAANFFVEGDARGYLRSEGVPGMDCSGHDRTGAVIRDKRRVDNHSYP
jgi:hypothetical protein